MNEEKQVLLDVSSDDERVVEVTTEVQRKVPASVISAKFIQSVVVASNRLIFQLLAQMILLTIYFWIALFKNANTTYHRSLLKVLSLTYYPNKSSSVIREDVAGLEKMPQRVACILDLRDAGDEDGGVEGLISDVVELVAWSISARIKHLTVYEYTGALTSRTQVTQLNRALAKNLTSYFGTESTPQVTINVPHANLTVGENPSSQLTLSLLSRVDGKPTIVELTKTMSELAHNNELNVDDISVELIDEELSELVGPEPDLLITFGPCLDLQDYPPWHIRLTEIYWEPDNKNMSYAVFLRALRKYANCKINVGK